MAQGKAAHGAAFLSGRLFPSSKALYMKKTYLQKIVAGEVLVIRRIGVGGDKNFIEISWSSHRDDDRAVMKIFLVNYQLTDIPWHDLSWGDFPGEGAGLLVAGEELIEIDDAGPGRSAVVDIQVIPAEGFGKIHYAAARIDTLGGKVGTVSANIGKIIVSGVESIGPLVGIGYSG